MPKRKGIIPSMYMNALGTCICSFVFDINFLCLYDIKVKWCYYVVNYIKLIC